MRGALLAGESGKSMRRIFPIGKRKECYRPWCGVEKLCVECAQSNSSLAAPTLLGRDFMTLKRFIVLELAKIEPQWTAEGRGGYWWGVKIGLETVLAKLCEMEGQAPTENSAACGQEGQ